ncbi:response regulator transcription factor [Phragmitibacter flavus]|uniref:Response regulator transcription factor n=1 Tax=Phragmitibacter flavus TaxID=2576071 RepID=A0A5R8K9T2_9BACT|nr:response regulator transcription factor [Phragmitibacter flavus]TLD69046.1 response regulator transcription factor [Phragmitibacter flavus]
MSIRILIIDDHFVQRLGLTVAINNEKDLRIAGQGGSVAEAVALYEKLKPDVTLMDFSLPDGTGVEAVKRIREKHDDAQILMLTVLDGEEDVFRASDAGAAGYLTKSADVKTLIAAIREVANGGTFFSESARAKIEARMKREPLTRRELEIVHLIVEGLANKEIGGRLGITEGTVKLHVAKVLTKTGAPDRTRAAILAVERGLVRLGG